MKAAVRFGKKGKLSPCYVGPYEILHNIGKVAYELRLPSEFGLVHPVFYVSMLMNCISCDESILPFKGLCFQEDLFYEKFPVEILDRHVKKLRNNEMAFIKVLLKNHLFKGAT